MERADRRAEGTALAMTPGAALSARPRDRAPLILDLHPGFVRLPPSGSTARRPKRRRGPEGEEQIHLHVVCRRAGRNDHRGKQLVQVCLNEARELGLPSIFALTYVPDFFEKLGFHRIDKAELPRKIWTECINCPKFPDCGEEAVFLRL